MTGPKIETWIKAGYELLGKEGMDGIKIERLARNLHLNKSGFYYYFKSMNFYMKSLLHHHVSLAHAIVEEVAACDNIDPDLLLLIVRHKDFFLVESQILVKSKTVLLNDDFDEAYNILNREFLSLWRKNGELPEEPAVALTSLNIIRHFLYARIDPENVTYEFLHALAMETKGVLDKVIGDRHLPPQNVTGHA